MDNKDKINQNRVKKCSIFMRQYICFEEPDPNSAYSIILQNLLNFIVLNLKTCCYSVEFGHDVLQQISLDENLAFLVRESLNVPIIYFKCSSMFQYVPVCSSTVKPLITNTSKEFIKCRILHFRIMEYCRYLDF